MTAADRVRWRLTIVALAIGAAAAVASSTLQLTNPSQPVQLCLVEASC